MVEDTEFLRLHNKANDRLKSAGQANEVVDFSELVSCMGEDFDEFYGLH